MSLVIVNNFLGENLSLNTIPILCLFLCVAEVLIFQVSKLLPRAGSSSESRDSQNVKKGQDFEPLDQVVSSRHEEDGDVEVEDMEIVMGKLGLFYQPDEGQKLQQRLGYEDMYSLFEDTKPSLEEVKCAFDVFDGNRDGFIDAEELQRVLCNLGFDQGFELENCRRMIGSFDENGDGRIEFQEFVKFMENTFC